MKSGYGEVLTTRWARQDARATSSGGFGMTAYSTTVRATHLLTNAAWFGGSLMGAVALNPAARQGDDSHEQAEIADEGWNRWGPVQGAAIGLHLLSGIAIVADNRRRVAMHPPTTTAVVLKTALTGVAVAASAAAYRASGQSWARRWTALTGMRRLAGRRGRSPRGCAGCSGPRLPPPPGCSSSTRTSASSSEASRACSTAPRGSSAGRERLPVHLSPTVPAHHPSPRRRRHAGEEEVPRTPTPQDRIGAGGRAPPSWPGKTALR